MERVTKENYYLDIAQTVSERSTCLRKRFGAIIVKNDVIISTGYNGAPRGRKNCSDLMVCRREQLGIPRGERYELCRSVHSEANAIIAAARENMLGASLYMCCTDPRDGSVVPDTNSCMMCKSSSSMPELPRSISAIPPTSTASSILPNGSPPTTVYPISSGTDSTSFYERSFCCMNKFTKSISLALAVLLLSGCSGTLVTLKYEDGKRFNKRLGLSYLAAPTNYEPVSVGEAYGYYEKADMTLYEIKGLNPKEWLTQSYAGSATTIFYDDDITLPTLAELNPGKIYITESESVTVSIGTVDDPAVIANVVDLFTNGTYAEWPLIDSYKIYELKFYSEENYPHIYYNLTYGEFEEGVFLYDRNTKHCVMIGDALADFIPSAKG